MTVHFQIHRVETTNVFIYLSLDIDITYVCISFPALSGWNIYQPTKSASRKKAAERDFIALNKASVQFGLTSAHEQSQFRATHDIRRREEAERVSSRSKANFPPDMVFGISTRCV